MVMLNGGGAFLIPYFIMLAFCALPLLIMEVAMGQYAGVTPLTLWNFCPAMRGIFLFFKKHCTSFLKYYWILSAHSFYITFSYKFGNKISSKGIGWGMVIVSGVATLYYIMLLTWSLFYLINCFRDPLPWKFCSGSGNRTDCTDFRNNVCLLRLKFLPK